MLLFYLSMLEGEESRDEFEELYHKYKDMMYKIAKYHTNNHHLAEEALQVTFVGIARNFDKIKCFDEKQMEIYLCKSTKNCAISVLRKEANSLNKTVSLDNKAVNEGNADIADGVAESELLNLIVEYIKSMKPEYADILTLYHLHNLTISECALALNIPLSTAKSRLYTARELLKKRFKEHIKW